MHILFLGTSSGAPTRERNVTSQIVRMGHGEAWMLDCGEGTQHRLLQSAVKPTHIARILITHLHGDHCYGLPGLLCSLAIHGRTAPLEIIGPTGLAAMVRTTLALSRAELPFAIDFVELERATDLGWRGDIALSAWPIVHRVPCFGYVLKQRPRRGALDVARARALGVPEGPLLGALTRGRDVTLPSGAVVRAADVLEPERPGPHLVLLGDTQDPSALEDAARGCDMLVHEATYDKSRREKALTWGHSTSAMAGAFAARVGAKTLVITHFSSRYTNRSSARSVADLVAEAAAECPGTTVLAADDFSEIKVS